MPTAQAIQRAMDREHRASRLRTLDRQELRERIEATQTVLDDLRGEERRRLGVAPSQLDQPLITAEERAALNGEGFETESDS